MSIEQSIEHLLRLAGCTSQSLPPKQVWKWQQAWRERFAKELFLDTGKWMLRGLDWHVLNSNYHDASTKEHALKCYASVEPGPFLVVSGSSHKDFGFICKGQPPELNVAGFDILIFPESLNWTMALTHSPDYGPFFAQGNHEEL